MESLRQATARAVAVSRPVADWLADEVESLATRLQQMPAPTPCAGFPDMRDLLAADRLYVEAVVAELRGLVAAQLRSIDHFNIVFFGRTLVGKSTAIEALAGGDGTTISDGRCDNTTVVEMIDWESCRLYDTPGINGWGRTVSREQLEEIAEEAVAEADLVVLSFDNFGQQDTEFGKVAAWVAAYGKPAVALFNVKNARWRLPARVPDRESRVTLSEPVAEHVAHIRTELAEIGLANVPIVAVHTHRAFAARTTNAFAGRDAVAVHRQRSEFGTARLWEWSNFGAFTGLVETAIGTDAIGLRLGRLFRQVIGALERADRIFCDEMQRPAAAAVVPVEDALRRILALLGAPAESDSRLRNLLRELREVHGRPIEGGPALGTAQRHAVNVIAAEIAGLRAEAQRKADEAVDTAMNSRTAMSSEEFSAHVFDTDAVTRKSHEVLAGLSAHLGEGLGLVVDDMRAEVSFTARPPSAIDGRAGRYLRRAGYGMGYGGLVCGAAAIAVGLSPVGWAIGTGLLVAGVVTLVGRGVGKLLRHHAASVQVSAQSKARVGARQAVNETIDGFQRALLEEYARMCAKAVDGAALPAAERAVYLHRVATAAGDRRAGIQLCRRRIEDGLRTLRQQAELPEDASWSAAEILQAAVARLEKSTGLTGVDLWLGETWIEDPDGIGAVPPRPPLPAPSLARSALRKLERRFRVVVDAVTAVPRPGSAEAWLVRVRRELGDAPGFRPYLDELARLAACRPQVVICGDYDTGKSSFIRRLLVDAGLRVPATLLIRGDPATTEIAEYEYGRLTLIDTPGFHSGIEAHSELARTALADAAGVLCLFSGNLVTDDRSDLTAVLTGDPDLGLPPKADRTLFIINRADELCPDPAADLVRFEELRTRKRAELHAALTVRDSHHGRTPSVALDQIFCIASDPHQIAGTSINVRAAAFDADRHWDGVDELRAALDDMATRLPVNAVDVTLLGGGITRLARWRTELSREKARIDNRVRQLDGLATEVRRRKRTGRAMAAERAALLGRQLSDFALAIVVEAAAQPEGGQERLAERLENLSADEAFGDVVEQWRRAGADEIRAWCAEARDGLSLRIERRSFAAAFPDASPAVADGPLRQATKRGMRGAIADVVDVVGKLTRYADRTTTAKAVVETAAKFSRSARFSLVVQGAAMAWEMYELVQEAVQDRARAREQIKLRKDVDAAARALADVYVAEDPSLAELADVLRALVAAHGHLARQAEEEQQPAAAVQDLIDRCDDIAAEARRLLGHRWGHHDRA